MWRDIFHMTVIFLPRKNVPSTERLAAVSLDDIKANKMTLSLAKGFGKERAVAIYMVENNIPGTDENIKALLGYKSQNVKKIIEEMQ